MRPIPRPLDLILRFQAPAKHSRELRMNTASQGEVPRGGGLALLHRLSGQREPTISALAQLRNVRVGQHDDLVLAFPSWLREWLSNPLSEIET